MEQILVVVDMQNDFIDGALGTKEAVDIVGNVVAKIREYQGCKIYLTRDTHFENYMDRQEGRKLPVPHCIKGSLGWKIRPEVIMTAESVTNRIVKVDKPSFGSIALSELIYQDSLMDDIEVELVGLCTDICVVSNALLLKAKMPEVPIKVDRKCVAGVTPKKNEAALLTMESCQIEIIG